MGTVTAEGGALKTGVWFPGGHSVGAMGPLAARAEQAGVDSVWVAEGQLGRDAFIGLAAVAQSTQTVTIGAAIVNIYTRHPAQLAASFATLDELSAGRTVCGVGIGARGELARLGYDVGRPLRAATESIDILRTLLAQQVSTLAGDKFQTDGAKLGFRRHFDSMPVYLAAAGPQMCALAGELADGIYLPHGTPEFIEHAVKRSHLRRPADRPFDVACQTLLSVDDDLEVARSRVRPAIGFILVEPNGESVLSANGLAPDKAQRIRDALADKGVRAMCAQIDDDVLERLTVAGDRDYCLARLQGLVGAGVTHVTVSLLDDHPEPALELLAALRRSSGEA